MASTSISKTFPSTRPCPRGKGNHLIRGQRQRHWCQRAGQTQTRSPFPSNTRRSIRRSLVGQEFQPEIWRRSRTTDAPQRPEKRRRNQDDPLPEGHCRAFSAVRAFAPGRTSELREARQGVGHRIFVLEGKLRTHQGTYGPGTWVWFPRGEIMEHGAPDAGDMTGTFIADGACDIFFSEATSSRSNRSG